MTPTTADQYDDTIDLRRAAEIVWRRRVPIAAVTIVVAVLVFIVVSTLPEKYEASAQVILTEPVMSANLDPRVRMDPQVPSRRGMAQLAMAPEILLEVLRAGVDQGLLPEGMTLNQFDGRCSATLAAENLIILSITGAETETASQLCNQWAERVTDRLNALFGIGREELKETAGRLAEARANWEEAEENLLKVLPETRVSTREDRLDEARAALRSRLEKIHQIDLLANEAKTVRRRLESIGDDGAGIDLGNMLSVIGLQGANADGLDDLTIEINGEAALNKAGTVGEARQALQHLVDSLTAQQDELREEAERIEETASERAVELERATHREAVATELRDLAQSAHEAVGNQLEQVRMAMSGNADTAKIAARATPPARPTSASPLLYALLAAVVTLFLCGLLSVALPPQRSVPDKPRP